MRILPILALLVLVGCITPASKEKNHDLHQKAVIDLRYDNSWGRETTILVFSDGRFIHQETSMRRFDENYTRRGRDRRLVGRIQDYLSAHNLWEMSRDSINKEIEQLYENPGGLVDAGWYKLTVNRNGQIFCVGYPGLGFRPKQYPNARSLQHLVRLIRMVEQLKKPNQEVESIRH